MDEETLLLLLLRRRRKRKILEQKESERASPKFWVRPIFKKREEFGEYHRLIDELRHGDREYFFRY